MEINDILANSSYFLRVYELKKKNKTLNFEKSKKNKPLLDNYLAAYMKNRMVLTLSSLNTVRN